MRKLIRSTLLAIFLLSLGVSTAPAQVSFSVFASSSDLEDGGTMSSVDAHCLVKDGGEIVLFNSDDGAIYSNDGSSTTILRDSTDLNADISAEPNPIDRCDGVEIDGNGNIYFLLRASESDGTNASNSHTAHVYKLPASGSPSVLATEDGLKGIEVIGGTAYLSGVAFRNAPADGFFSISSSGTGQSVTTVATKSSLDLTKFLVSDSNGDLYSFSGGFGEGDEQSVIVQLADPSGSATIGIWADPYAGPFVNPGDDGLEDMSIVQRDGADRYYVYNASFSAADGEQFGVYQSGGASPSVFANQTDIENAIGNGITGGFTEPMLATQAGEVFFANRDGFGDPNQIIKMSSVPLPVEMAGFDAVHNGSSVELTWQTAGETNNAGFTVQRETESGWTSLDFVESKVTGGTTTETTSYRYTVQQELDPGTHRFRLQQKDLDGSTSLSDVVTVEVGLNEALTLQSPMPNPTRVQATVEFGVKEATETSVAIYNVLGQRVKTLYQGTPQANQMRDVTFNAGSLPSGVYFVRMQADGQTRTERLTVVR